jgi:predicted transcriptional regulator
MKLVTKTLKKVVIELTAKEIEKNSFEFFWDKIRSHYPKEDYDVDSIGCHKGNDQKIFVELVSNKN